MKTLLTRAAAIGAAALAAGCATPPPAADASGRPSDFALSITVISPQDDPTLASALARPMRPARYIVESDGVLRAAVGPGALPEQYPAQTRRLDHRQLARLWKIVEQSGLAATDISGHIPAEESYSPLYGSTMALISITQGGRRDTVVVDMEAGNADAQSATLLVDQVAAWAWVRP